MDDGVYIGGYCVEYGGEVGNIAAHKLTTGLTEEFGLTKVSYQAPYGTLPAQELTDKVPPDETCTACDEYHYRLPRISLTVCLSSVRSEDLMTYASDAHVPKSCL